MSLPRMPVEKTCVIGGSLNGKRTAAKVDMP